MDETALALMVIDPQRDDPFEPLAHWERALRAAVRHDPARLLVAARCDRGGLTVSQARVEEYCREHGYTCTLDTAAKTGDGCMELQSFIAQHIPWERIPWTATTRLFKALKEAIVRVKGTGVALTRLAELRQRLQLELPGERVGERDVLEAGLDFKDMPRLAEADEKILLRAMLQTFLDRSLCARVETDEGTQLVFPSYFRQDRPDSPERPGAVVTYGFAGTVDEVYSTLVVRLHYTNGFEMGQLWRYAADFTTLAGQTAGLRLAR